MIFRIFIVDKIMQNIFFDFEYPTPYALCYKTMNMLAVIVKKGCSETVFASL